MVQAHSVMHITIRTCFLCFFYNPYIPFLIPIIFHRFVSTLFLHKLHGHYSFSAYQELNFLLRGRIQSVGLCTQYTNEICAPFCTSPNCSIDSSPETREGSYMYVLTYNLALGQETVATRFNRPRSRGATQRARYIALLWEAR